MSAKATCGAVDRAARREAARAGNQRLRKRDATRSVSAKGTCGAVAGAARREAARAGKMAPLLSRRPVTYQCALVVSGRFSGWDPCSPPQRSGGGASRQSRRGEGALGARRSRLSSSDRDPPKTPPRQACGLSASPAAGETNRHGTLLCRFPVSCTHVFERTRRHPGYAAGGGRRRPCGAG